MRFHRGVCNGAARMLAILLASSLLSSLAFGDVGQKILGLDHKDRIPDQYIVVMKDDQQAMSTFSLRDRMEIRMQRLEAMQERMQGMFGVRIQKRFQKLLGGFVVKASRWDVEEIAADDEVAFVEADRIVSINATQKSATWGIDRIDSREGRDGAYNYNYTGRGVHAYIIDTGVLSSHNEFSGRMGQGYSSISDGRGSEDCNGHGTHVAGTVGGSTYGVAKEVTIHGVRVLGCNGSGSNSGVIAGVEWVAENAIKPAVANMSLGGGASSALDRAVEKAIDAGITFVVAAGNSSANACGSSPARVADAITVGSTDSSDRRSSFSNYGSCVDIFAPGSSITSAGTRSSNATATLSGTSMASPHVAGAAALILEADPKASAAQVTRTMIAQATSGAISSVGSGSPNLFLFTSPSGGDTPDPEPDPDPEPNPDPDPCSGCDIYSDSLSGTDDYMYAGEEYYSSPSFVAKLKGPASADFDLSLQKYSWFWGWRTVARSEGASSDETIEYSGSSGDYRWVVYSASGEGAFTLTVE
ncbi:S8 family peptidase [Pseudobacteriovorax antillogorgiicola]|uniref:Serine protease, subtilisin family n=1 Tax=Pseudobacteriovorax antillogorgiicola TaxID=1513793 RepID=A0A1Y6BLZ1_9BACT|nr:S8 family peptidase [Pseudobacteriovorax antillogorgiicola]TCS55590.1 subtilisin family serine protease [Pseudobacteriovorax antillogorgiicola]SMF10550.1 Serine protease, subtilisin family [Pseudobacteriovorax antillogorgiicola]